MAVGIGDVSLDGKKYKVDVMSYRGRDVIDFAPRASVPGGSVIMSDLGLYQPLVQTDWQHGVGFHWYSDAQGYLTSYGNIDTRQDGLVMLMTKPTDSDNNNNAKLGFVNWNSAVYSWGAGGLRKYNGTSWSSIYSTAAVNYAMAAGDYLFFCPDGVRVQKINTSDTVSVAGLDANSTDYKWMVIHNGFIYAGKDGTNRIHYADQVDLSDLEGTTADTNAIYVGVSNSPTLGAIVYAGQLYVSRADGLWHIGDDNIARCVLNYSQEQSSGNFSGMAIINGFLVFPIRNKMIQWNGTRISDFTPTKMNDVYPFSRYGEFSNLVAVDNNLFLTAHSWPGTYAEHLLCYDGVGWHQLVQNVATGADAVSGMGYDTVNNRLWYHVQASVNLTHYIQFGNISAMPYADFSTSTSSGLITSRMDMGFRRVEKSMTSLWVEAYNLTTTRYINVYYSIDGGSWVLWDKVDTNGVTELKYPGSERTREFNYLQLKFDFVTATAAQSPVLESYTVRFIMRPDTVWGYNFNIVAVDEGISDYMQDERDASEIVRELRTVRNSKAPIEMVDLLGDTIYGYITSVTEQPTYRRTQDEDEAERLEYWVHINFVSMGE